VSCVCSPILPGAPRYIHSYLRRLAVTRKVPVKLRIRVRHFFYGDPSCEKPIFTERPCAGASHAQRTERLQEALVLVDSP